MNISRPGFTLIETSVALLLLSMSALLTLDLFTLAGQALRRPPPPAETIRLLGLLRTRIEGAYPAWIADEPSRPHVEFYGEARRLELAAPTPETLSAGGLSRWQLALATDPAGAARLDLSVRGLPTETLRLGHGDAGFAYYGRIAPEAAPSWHTNWQNQPTLPLLVRLRLGTLPELTVAPQLTPQAACHPAANPCPTPQ